MHLCEILHSFDVLSNSLWHEIFLLFTLTRNETKGSKIEGRRGRKQELAQANDKRKTLWEMETFAFGVVCRSKDVI